MSYALSTAARELVAEIRKSAPGSTHARLFTRSKQNESAHYAGMVFYDSEERSYQGSWSMPDSFSFEIAPDELPIVRKQLIYNLERALQLSYPHPSMQVRDQQYEHVSAAIGTQLLLDRLNNIESEIEDEEAVGEAPAPLSQRWRALQQELGEVHASAGRGTEAFLMADYDEDRCNFDTGEYAYCNAKIFLQTRAGKPIDAVEIDEEIFEGLLGTVFVSASVSDESSAEMVALSKVRAEISKLVKEAESQERKISQRSTSAASVAK